MRQPGEGDGVDMAREECSEWGRWLGGSGMPDEEEGSRMRRTTSVLGGAVDKTTLALFH